jgi:hypothetical protein
MLSALHLQTEAGMFFMRTPGWLTLIAVAFLAACASHQGSAPSLPPAASQEQLSQQTIGDAIASSKITYYNIGSGTNDYEGFTPYVGANGIIYYGVLAQPTCNPAGFAGRSKATPEN